MNSQKVNKSKKEKFSLMKMMKQHKKKSAGVAASALFLSILTFNLAFAKGPSEVGLKEIYHIYNGEQYIGAVADAETVNTLVEMKTEDASKQYSEYSIEVGSNIVVVPEQVYTVAVNEQETLEQLEQSVEAEVKAHAFVVDGEPVAYLKDEADFNKTIELLKLNYVSQEQLNELNASSTKQVPLSTKNETRIVKVDFNENVKTEQLLVKPEQVLTPKEAEKLLSSGSLVQEVYKVKADDVLGAIAKKHGLTTAQLLEINPELTVNTVLKIDQPIHVTVKKPFVNITVQKEKYRKVDLPFEVIKEEDASMLKGETKVVQQGSKGVAERVIGLTYVNGVETDRTVVSENVLKEKVDKKVIVGTKVIPDRGTGSFAWPTVGGYVSSHLGQRWGRHHDGIDIARPSDRTIKASDNGRVIFADWDGTYGQKVVIDHNNGYQTVYGHLASISVSVGQTVGQGQKLGIMGSTGRSTGVHLHFEVKKNGALVNPLSVLK